MKILITGNMGYIGPVLIKYLRSNLSNSYIVGYDTGYFSHCLTSADQLPESRCNIQYFGDIRNLEKSFLQDFDSIVILSAISNDPMGAKFEKTTKEINFLATKDLIEKFDPKDGQRIVFASSCSMYGTADLKPKKESDELNPLTAYAKSKVAIEKVLKESVNSKAICTSLRFATACGMSERLRLDLVLNDFVAAATVNKKITVLSDGSPWRPLIHVKDMSRAIHWALQRNPTDSSPYVAVNTGSNKWNYQVKDLANSVARVIEGTKIEINKDAQPDKRSYKVDFSYFNKIAKGFLPECSLEETILEIQSGLLKMSFDDKNFRSSTLMRLKALEKHQSENRLSESLYWL